MISAHPAFDYELHFLCSISFSSFYFLFFSITPFIYPSRLVQEGLKLALAILYIRFCCIISHPIPFYGSGAIFGFGFSHHSTITISTTSYYFLASKQMRIVFAAIICSILFLFSICATSGPKLLLCA